MRQTPLIEKMAGLLHDGFVIVRHQTGEQFNKEEFLDYITTGIRDMVIAEDRSLIYDDEDIVVSHSILDGRMGYNAEMLAHLVKDGKFTRQETGVTPLPAE